MSVTSLYEGGFGGKKANLAAMDEVTPPISPFNLSIYALAAFFFVNSYQTLLTQIDIPFFGLSLDIVSLSRRRIPFASRKRKIASSFSLSLPSLLLTLFCLF